MKQLKVLILAADDVSPEKNELFQLMAELNKQYAGQAELISVLDPKIPADLVLALLWTQAQPDLAATSSARFKYLLRKTDTVRLDLSQRDEILQRLEQKAVLDAQLTSLSDDWQHFAFGEENPFIGVAESTLKRFIDSHLGISSELLSLRPQLGTAYVSRPRLLEQLPDEVGHIVHLEAPYGYGKSVLAAQWAAQLEKDGWRIIWLAQVEGQALKPLIATALGLATDSPDGLVRERLWEEITLLVVEDLTEDAELEFLLEGLEGLLLLASRKPLKSALLSRQFASGQASHLDANELAFTLGEAEALTGDKTLAIQLHSASLGWSLPLHVAALTGSAPDASSLLAGIQASLNPESWQELLFLAALPYLPQALITEASQTLIQKGFVQRLETSARLHPFIADVAFERFAKEIGQQVRQDASRLPLLLQAEAFDKCGDFEQLVQVLEATDAELWKRSPLKLIDWDARAKGLDSPYRDWTIGAAHGRLGNFAEAVSRLERALQSETLSDTEKLAIMRHLCMPLALSDSARGPTLIAQAEVLLDRVEGESAGLFLGNAALIHAYAGDYQAAISTAERALTFYPAASPQRLGQEINLALFRWHLYGDFDFRLQTQRATLERAEELYPIQALGQCRDLAMLHWWLGDLEEARIFLKRANQANLNPAIATEAQAALAYLDKNSSLLNELNKKARDYSNPEVSGRVSMYKILHDLAENRLELASYTYEASPKEVFASSAYARVLATEGKTEEALALLANFDHHTDRSERLYLESARFIITTDKKYLDAFLAQTTAAERLLPGFIDLEKLPKRTELARHYPIREILDSKWTEAIKSRHGDIPALELRLLGEVTVFLLGQALELADRQKQILTLLSLELSRDEVAEAMWPDVDGKKQRNNLNVQLNLLRKAIEPWGTATYLFESGLKHVDSDYQALREALEQRDSASVYQLYQDPFAPGIDLIPAIEMRESLREDVVDLLVDTDEESGTDSRYLVRVLELDPLHEEALQKLLKHLRRRGRKREARLRYKSFTERLESELGLEPLEETRALLE